MFSQDETEELTFAEAEEKRYEQEKLMEALKKEIASDENVIIPIHEEKYELHKLLGALLSQIYL